jgi:anti-sigma B factor antagonist
MEINITDGLPTIVTVKGRLDTVSAPAFEKAVTPVMDGNMKETVIDCAGLDYISSSGLRIFLSILKAAKAKQGVVIIRKMNETIKEIFYMTGFTGLFDFES